MPAWPCCWALILRRVTDVLMVLVPLAAAALATAIICWLIGLQLNFANIIALPLLLGIGVAFNIYFVVNWRNGIGGPLQTSTARAVLFSALTTGSSFASLARLRPPRHRQHGHRAADRHGDDAAQHLHLHARAAGATARADSGSGAR